MLATKNKGKLKEIAVLLRKRISELRPLSDFNSAEIEETGASYRENALIKARVAFQSSGWASLADDSGFEVAALGGQPGLNSARWAEKEDGKRDFAYAIARIEKELEKKVVIETDAKFVCALALVRCDGEERVVQGEVRGKVVFPPRGTNGFGYDPIFVAESEKITFAEMDPSAKERISHRAKAFKTLCDKCFTQ